MSKKTTHATDSISPVRLRPHHLLCLQNFRGKGYSPAFIRKMTEISACLTVSPRVRESRPAQSDVSMKKDLPQPSPVLLVSGADDLCACCPHCVSGRCSSLNPDLFDSLVLTHTGLSSGHLLPEELLSDSIPAMTESLLETCCPGCSWLETCRLIIAEKSVL